MTTTPRRTFLGLLPAGVALAYAPAPAEEPPALHDEFPSQDPALVREIVGAAHSDVDTVRRLVTDSPALAKSAWDWGFGDWESALGAASHMGRRDIAGLLIAHGARPNLFTHAMLGDLEVVRASIAAQPGIQGIPGPHGISLLAHARIAKQEKLVAFLEQVGGADPQPVSLEVGDEQKRRYLGTYVWGPGPDERFDVVTSRSGRLAVRRGERFIRTLHRVEPHGFAPSGAPAVRVRFRVEGERVLSLSVHDPHPLVVARRVDLARAE